MSAQKDSLAELARGAERYQAPVALEPREEGPEFYERTLDSLRILRIVPCVFDQCGVRGFTRLLNSLQRLHEPISLEVVAQKDSILCQCVCQQDDLQVVKGAIQAHLTYGYVREESRLNDPFYCYVMKRFRSSDHQPSFYFKTAHLPGAFFYVFDSEIDLLSPLYRTLERVTREENLRFALLQVLILPVHSKWERVAEGALRRKWGEDSVPRSEINDLKKKFGLPCFATAIRVCAFGYNAAAKALVETICAGLSAVVRGKDGRGLAWTSLEIYERSGLQIAHQLHLFKARVSFQTGMILNSQELAKFSRFPTVEISSTAKGIYSSGTVSRTTKLCTRLYSFARPVDAR